MGSGTYGVVHRVRHKETKQIRACKTISLKKIKDKKKFEQEIQILQRIDHPNVLKLYEYFEDAKNFYLVTELCSGGELFDKIVENEFFTEYQAAWIFKQILGSVSHLHKHNICHRDLKPENFMIASKCEDLLEC